MLGHAGQEQGRSLGSRLERRVGAAGLLWDSHRLRRCVRGGFQESREKLKVVQVQVLASSGHVALGVVMETDSSDLGTESPHGALRKRCPLLGAELCPPNLYTETPTPT